MASKQTLAASRCAAAVRSAATPDHRLSADKPVPGQHQLRYVPSAGVESGFWWADLLTDQRPVDAYSLTYDSEPLTRSALALQLVGPAVSRTQVGLQRLCAGRAVTGSTPCSSSAGHPGVHQRLCIEAAK